MLKIILKPLNLLFLLPLSREGRLDVSFILWHLMSCKKRRGGQNCSQPWPGMAEGPRLPAESMSNVFHRIFWRLTFYPALRFRSNLIVVNIHHVQFDAGDSSMRQTTLLSQDILQLSTGSAHTSCSLGLCSGPVKFSVGKSSRGLIRP